MRDTLGDKRQLVLAMASVGVVVGAAVSLGVPWQGVLVALVTMILSAAAVQGMRRRDREDPETEGRGRILYLRKRRGGR